MAVLMAPTANYVIRYAHQMGLSLAYGTVYRCLILATVVPFSCFYVDEDAFKALIACASEGTIETCDLVPAGEGARLSNPIAGIAVDMAGPARYS